MNLSTQQALELALARHNAGELNQAESLYQQILVHTPNNPDAWHLLGVIAHQRGRHQKAEELISRAIKLSPNAPQFYNNLGLVLKDLGKINEAVAAYQAALKLNPVNAQVHYNLGSALMEFGRLSDAIHEFDTALKLNSTLTYAHSNKIFAMHLLPDFSPRVIRDELSAWNRMHALPVKGSIQPHENNPDPDRRLAIGYVSSDFGQHVVAWNLLPLLKQHDHKQFFIFCYSNAAHKDSVTGQLQSCVDGWRNIAGVDDDRAAQMIRDDQIDILVDLAVHTPRNRLLIFARKPAPIAVTYLGYCGSTGLDTVDYRFSDPFLDPPETDLTLYSEQTVHLPRSYWCYRPGGPSPNPSPPPALAAGFVTFGCLNNFAKLSSAALGLWIPILQRVANSKLILHSNPGPHLNVLREALATAGITADRLEFIGKQPWPKYIETYNRIDIALDTVPYNGGITTCDALFMDVPVVSLSGQMAVGRAGRSILSNVGLSELIAQTPQQYVNIAVELAGDITRLSEMRSGLRNRMQTSPLMDAEGFARNVEAAYRGMWHMWTKSRKE